MSRHDVIGIDASRVAVKHKTGTETYTFQLLWAIAKIAPPEQFELYLNAKEPPAGLPSIGTPICMPFPRFWTHVRLSAEMVRRRPSLLFVPAHVAPLIHPRTVVTIHDLGYLVHPESHPAQNRRMLDLSTRWSARTATRLIAISETTKADLVRFYGVPPDRVDVVPHGVSESMKPAPEDEIARVRHELNLPGRYILALGTVQPRKNYGRLAEAVSRLRSQGEEVTLVIAGKRGWMAREVESEIATAGAPVRLLGYVDDSDLPALYSGAAVYGQPSLYEGFGMPLLEAMACGVPVVAAGRSSLPEVGGDAALYVDPFDPAAIAAGLARVLASENLRRDMAARGKIRAASFTWERTARETLDVFRVARAM